MGGGGTTSASIACNEGGPIGMRGDTTNNNSSSVAGGIIGSSGGPDNWINSLVNEDIEFEDIELDKVKMPAI